MKSNGRETESIRLRVNAMLLEVSVLLGGKTKTDEESKVRLYTNVSVVSRSRRFGLQRGRREEISLLLPSNIFCGSYHVFASRCALFFVAALLVGEGGESGWLRMAAPYPAIASLAAHLEMVRGVGMRGEGKSQSHRMRARAFETLPSISISPNRCPDFACPTAQAYPAVPELMSSQHNKPYPCRAQSCILLSPTPTPNRNMSEQTLPLLPSLSPFDLRCSCSHILQQGRR